MAGFKDLFIPREVTFFKHLQKQVLLLESASKKLDVLIKNNTDKQIDKCHTTLKKDLLLGESFLLWITKELHLTFITPIDREEIQTLSLNLNRTLHSIEAIIAFVQIYRIPRLNSSMKSQIKLLQSSITQLVSIFQHPLCLKENQKAIEYIKTIENKADVIYREALRTLFLKSKNPVEIMKKKDILQIIEEAIDKTEYIANVMQNVLINHA